MKGAGSLLKKPASALGCVMNSFAPTLPPAACRQDALRWQRGTQTARSAGDEARRQRATGKTGRQENAPVIPTRKNPPQAIMTLQRVSVRQSDQGPPRKAGSVRRPQGHHLTSAPIGSLSGGLSLAEVLASV